ncbi:unnamed protein product [Rotaria socialis]|uniref:NAD-dependent protein deacetylase n=1 Tax=Rotaria socialis TaxID=392032 RepID=A0A820RID5_9BILA|nr:unnamed protein product [Rotaria socialis]CAF3414287.1 unnamed protein product [Rotaria socialis]CAF3500052.1 unnamed protein product [Rotaria socialis]CAF4436900.1 unnamed protein product [Rotaria socialis]CAF4541112.1 unnamed protein product [Rotaria socialis]
MAESEKPADEKDEKQTEEDDEEDSASKLSLLMNKFANLMGAAVSNEPAENPVLKSFDLKCAAEYMSKCSNVIVMAGAGISTSAGIPDFRSPGTGLYSQLEKYNLPFPEAIFQLDYFRNNPKPFFLLAKELYPQKYTPTPTHYFLRLLNDKSKLLRIFTQNIDSLERIAGVPPEKIVEAHGTFFASHCLNCRKEYDLEFVKEIISKDEIPHCTECDGIVKPDIVFFGESLPARFSECVQTDFDKADFLIIIGTSLKVAPFNRLTNFVGKDCPRLLINLEPAGTATSVWDLGSSSLLFGSSKNRRDVFHKSTCDEGVTELAKLLDWEDDFNELLESEGVSAESVKKNLSTIPDKTEESANRLAEQMAAASLNDDKKEQ